MTQKVFSSVSRSVVVFAILILVVGSLSLYLYVQNGVMASQISKLSQTNDSLRSQISSLSGDKERLSSQVEQLNQTKTDLQATIEYQEREIASLNSKIEDSRSQVRDLNQQIASLNEQVQSLTQDRAIIQSKFDELEDRMGRIRLSYGEWETYLSSYSTWNLNYTVKRVFTDQETLALKDLLSSKVLSAPSNFWASCQDIYYWITKNVKYARDGPFPICPSFDDLENGQVKSEVVFDYMMAPSQTLQIMQGDCDDQAALAFSMVKSYSMLIYGKEYSQWLISIVFNNDKAHMAMAIPSRNQDGRMELTILDPAGSYLTGSWGSIGSANPLQELLKYSSHWKDQGGIKTITVYKIENDMAYILESGNINEVAKFISGF